MIKLSNINKYYFKNKSNEIHVVNNLSLQLDEKGFTTILGPSGSGKSTLLHIIGGLDSASGTVQYDDLVFTRLCGNQMDLYRNQHIGYIFQNYHLLPDLTVYQNLKIQLELVGIKDEVEIENRINICLKAIGMEKYKRRNVTALSGGQQQRVAIARALVKGAKVIIADEPTGNLDSKNSIEVMNILKRLSKKCLVVLVTHDKTLANHYSDRIIDIKDGQIVNDRVNDNDDSYYYDDSSTIYLDEYEQKVLSDNNQKVVLYTNDKNDLQLKIIVENNTIYIQNEGLPIQIIGEHTQREVKKSRSENENNKVEEEHNLAFSTQQEITFKQKFLNVMEVLKNSLLSFFFAKKSTWLMYLSFFFIGALLCCCIGFYNYSTAIDKSIVSAYPGYALRVDPRNATNEEAYFGYDFEENEVYEIINEEDNGVIGLVERIEKTYFYYPYIGNRNLTYTVPKEAYAATPNMIKEDIVLHGNEIAISSKLARDLVKYYSSFGLDELNDLYSATFTASFEGIYRGGVIIKEIFNCDNNTILFSDDIYYMLHYYSASASEGVNFRCLKPGEELENLRMNGSTAAPYQAEVVISENLVGLYNSGPLSSFAIIGSFTSDEFEVVYLNESDYNKFLKDYVAAFSLNVVPYENIENLKLVDGNLPVNDNEVIISDALKDDYAIGDNYGQYKVSGYFETRFGVNTSVVYSNQKTAYLKKLTDIYKNEKNKDGIYDFYVTDVKKAKDYFLEKGYESIIVEDKVLQDATNRKMKDAEIAILVLLGISIVMIVFIFFMSRSKIMHSIYNIGVYRALGAKKSRIYTKYLIDSLVMATLTAVLGFMIIFVVMTVLDNYITNLTVKPLYALGVVVLLYVFMVLASLLPVYTLLRKTPIEIIVKYDI